MGLFVFVLFFLFLLMICRQNGEKHEENDVVQHMPGNVRCLLLSDENLVSPKIVGFSFFKKTDFPNCKHTAVT